MTARVIRSAVMVGAIGAFLRIVQTWTPVSNQRFLGPLVLAFAIFVGSWIISRDEIGFKALFGAGMIITLTVTVLEVANLLVGFYLLSPDWVHALQDASRRQMEQPDVSGVVIKQTPEALGMLPGLMAGATTVWNMVLGFVTSIVAATMFGKRRSSRRDSSVSSETATKAARQSARPQAIRTALKFGVIAGLLFDVLGWIEWALMGREVAWWLWWLNILVFAAIVFLGVQSIRKQEPATGASFKGLFKVGMTITVSMTVLQVMYFLLYMYAINTNWMDVPLDAISQHQRERGASEDSIRHSLDYQRKLLKPFIFATMIFQDMTVGSVSSFVAALSFRRKGSPEASA